MGFYCFDYTYFIFLIPAILVSLLAQIYLQNTFNKYSRISTRANITGSVAAYMVTANGGIFTISVQPIAGILTDHFDPRTNIISLSENVFASYSVAAVGVAAHEAGHALQHAESYFPIRLRSALVPVTKIASIISWPIIIIGLYLPVQYDFFIYLGIALFSFSVFFTLVALPVEFNASFRAVKYLEQTGKFSKEEMSGVKKVLTAAALSYVAVAFTSILSLLRILLILSRRSRN